MDEMEKAVEMKLQLVETLSALRFQMDNVEFCASLRCKDVEAGVMGTGDALGWVEDEVRMLEAIARKARKKLHALAKKHMAID